MDVVPVSAVVVPGGVVVGLIVAEESVVPLVEQPILETGKPVVLS